MNPINRRRGFQWPVREDETTPAVGQRLGLLAALGLMLLAGCSPVTPAAGDSPASPTAPPPAATPAVTRTLDETATPARGLTARPIPSATPITAKEQTPMAEPPAGGQVQPGLERFVGQAKADLARRTGLAAGQIELISAEMVTWPDGSLGCPQPGMVYPQMLVEGLLIRLAAAGRDYEYHSGGQGEPFLCPKGTAPLRAPTS